MLHILIGISRNYCLDSGRCYYVTWNKNKENKILFLFERRLHLPSMGSESTIRFRTFIFFIWGGILRAVCHSQKGSFKSTNACYACYWY